MSAAQEPPQQPWHEAHLCSPCPWAQRGPEGLQLSTCPGTFVSSQAASKEQQRERKGKVGLQVAEAEQHSGVRGDGGSGSSRHSLLRSLSPGLGVLCLVEGLRWGVAGDQEQQWAFVIGGGTASAHSY